MLVNAAVNTVLLPAQIVADPVKVTVGTGAIVILTILLVTGVQAASKSLTTARYHLSPIISEAVIELVVGPKVVQVVWSVLICQAVMAAEKPFKVITGIVPKLQAVAALAVAVPATGAGLTETVADAETTGEHGALVTLTK